MYTLNINGLKTTSDFNYNFQGSAPNWSWSWRITGLYNKVKHAKMESTRDKRMISAKLMLKIDCNGSSFFIKFLSSVDFSTYAKLFVWSKCYKIPATITVIHNSVPLKYHFYLEWFLNRHCWGPAQTVIFVLFPVWRPFEIFCCAFWELVLWWCKAAVNNTGCFLLQQVFNTFSSSSS